MGLPGGAAFSEGLATEGTEFTGRFFLLPLTGQPLLQPGYVEPFRLTVARTVELVTLPLSC